MLVSVYPVTLAPELTVFKGFGVDSMAFCLQKVQLQFNVTAVINLETS